MAIAVPYIGHTNGLIQDLVSASEKSQLELKIILHIFCQVLAEDSSTNRMNESLRLFKEVNIIVIFETRYFQIVFWHLSINTFILHIGKCFNLAYINKKLVYIQMCHSPYFVNSAMILFLNKKDRFAEKLGRSPLKNYFPNYNGIDDFKEASKYIWGLFMECRGEKVHKKINYLFNNLWLIQILLNSRIRITTLLKHLYWYYTLQ